MAKIVAVETYSTVDFEKLLSNYHSKGYDVIYTNSHVVVQNGNLETVWHALVMNKNATALVTTVPDIVITSEQYALIKECVSYRMDDLCSDMYLENLHDLADVLEVGKDTEVVMLVSDDIL